MGQHVPWGREALAMHLWWVRLPSGPLVDLWGVGITGLRLLCTQKIGVRLSDAPLD